MKCGWQAGACGEQDSSHPGGMAWLTSELVLMHHQGDKKWYHVMGNNSHVFVFI